MQIVFRGRSTLRTILAFFSNLGLQLNGPCKLVYRVGKYRRQLTSSGSGSSSSSSAACSVVSSDASGVSSAFCSSVGASAYTVEKREETNEVNAMVAFGRVAIGWRPARLFTRFVRHHATWTRTEEDEWYIGGGVSMVHGSNGLQNDR